MDDKQVLARIHELVAEEHELRSHGRLDDAGRARLNALEAGLDQCWDLLRRRRAATDSGTDPDVVKPQPPEQVESYLQ